LERALSSVKGGTIVDVTIAYLASVIRDTAAMEDPIR
jgi:hypothetical protein